LSAPLASLALRVRLVRKGRSAIKVLLVNPALRVRLVRKDRSAIKVLSGNPVLLALRGFPPPLSLMPGRILF